MERFTPRAVRARAWTLIELLVVVAILAVLAAMVLLLSSKQRDSAAAAACVSNLRTIGVALHQYMADHAGAIPPMSTLAPNNNTLIAQKELAPYTGVDTSGAMPTADNAGRAYKPWICPSDREPRNRSNPNSPRWKFYNSYLVNYYVGASTVSANGTPSNPRTVTRSANVGNIQSLWYLADGCRLDGGQGRMTVDTVSNAGPSGAGELRFRHGDKINVLTFGGSVASFTRDQVLGKGDEFLTPQRQ